MGHRSGIFVFQAEDGIRYAQESRGLGDVYKRQLKDTARFHARLGRLLVDARATGRDAFRAIDERMGLSLIHI